ncbi:MAG TPA: hypothetical protein VH592_23745 [Gemmataceae bacterium]|jgi:DICT domain-containing protein
MPRFNVHLYREMRLLFEGIDAATHEEAAATARNRLTEDADAIATCDGETFAALVDVVGDKEFQHYRIIAFEDERLRKAAPQLLRACQYVQPHLEEYVRWHHKHQGGCSVEMEQALDLINDSIAKATAAEHREAIET